MSNNSINFTINLNGNAYKGILQIDNAVEQVIKSVESAKNSLQSIGSSAVFFNNISEAVNKATGAFRSLVGTSLEFEQQQANLKTLLNGDAEATKNLVAQIREYGKATVYDRSSLIEAQKTMMAFGLNAEFAFGKLKNIGDIALGDSQKMQSLALAFSQATSMGKLMGQDFLQMVNAGFNPLEVISQKTGKSMAELKDEMSKGQISADMLAQSFEWATEEGGRFYQGAETAAQTTAGRIAKMKDTIDELKVSLFEATGGATAYIAEAGNLFSEITDIYGGLKTIKEIGVSLKSAYGKLMNFTKKQIVALMFQIKSLQFSIGTTGGFFKGLAATAKVACRAIGTAIKNIPIIGWIAAAIAAVIALFQLLWERCEGFRRLLFGLWEVIKAIASHLWSVFKEGVAYVWSIVQPFIDTIKSYVSELWINIVEGATWLWQTVVNVATEIGDFFVGVWEWISTSATSAFDWIVAKLGAVGKWISEHFIAPLRNAFSSVWEWIGTVVDKMLSGLSGLFEPIRKLWNKLFPDDLIEDVKQAYAIGAEKGSASFRADQKEKEDEESGVLGMANESLQPILKPKTQKENTNGKGNGLNGGSLGRSAGEVAGKAQQINITLEKMVETINFNGTMKENSNDVEQRLREIMARILGMAETAI